MVRSRARSPAGQRITFTDVSDGCAAGCAGSCPAGYPAGFQSTDCPAQRAVPVSCAAQLAAQLFETCEGPTYVSTGCHIGRPDSARPLKMFRFTIRRKPVRRTNIRLLSYASLFSSEISVSNLFQRTCAMRIHEQRERRVEPGTRLKNSRLIGFLEAAPSPQQSEAG